MKSQRETLSTQVASKSFENRLRMPGRELQAGWQGSNGETRIKLAQGRDSVACSQVLRKRDGLASEQTENKAKHLRRSGGFLD
jgi:hypothetical protein